MQECEVATFLGEHRVWCHGNTCYALTVTIILRELDIAARRTLEAFWITSGKKGMHCIDCTKRKEMDVFFIMHASDESTGYFEHHTSALVPSPSPHCPLDRELNRTLALVPQKDSKAEGPKLMGPWDHSEVDEYETMPSYRTFFQLAELKKRKTGLEQADAVKAFPYKAKANLKKCGKTLPHSNK
ncbi:hypothetical protein COOONC_00552 [Cooperia oncophora]